MTWKLLGIVAVLSLPFSVALWHKSHHNPGQYRYDVTLFKSMRVYLKDGICGVRVLSLPTKTNIPGKCSGELKFNASPDQQSLMLSSVRKGSSRVTWLVFPLWLSTFLLLTVSAIPVVRGPGRRWWRQWHGLCVECGYNLLANRSGRCPECGTRFRAGPRRVSEHHVHRL